MVSKMGEKSASPQRTSNRKVPIKSCQRYAAMTNIGQRPTLDNGSRVTIETHLLDFDADLYGQQLKVEFVQRLRDERKFDNLNALKAQLNEDARQVRRYL